MNVCLKYGTGVTIEIKWEHLHVMYAVLALIKQFAPESNTQFYAIYHAVEGALRKKVILEAEAKRFKLCSKCCREIDTEKDKYHHTQFESGYEIWTHQDCPPTNQGKGYQ